MAINHSSVYHFADNTNLLNINTSPKRIQNQINLDIKYKWLLTNKSSLNCSKTELAFFHNPGHPIQNFNFNIKINGHKISPSNCIKYIGISLDETLSGKNHCTILTNKLKRANGMLSRIRYVPREELKSIYCAIFSSHMTYRCQIWGQNCSAHLIKISKLQNRALRIINFEDFNDNPSTLYKNEKNY